MELYMPYKQSFLVAVILILTIEQVHAQKCPTQNDEVFHDCVISKLKSECASAESSSNMEACYKKTMKMILEESGLIGPQDDVSAPVECKKKEGKFECEWERAEHPMR
jgi:hypothetical protein